MKRFAILTCVATVCSAVGALSIEKIQNDKEEDVGSAVVMGVCKIDSEHVSCWDSEGKPSSEFTRSVEASLTQVRMTRAYSPQPHPELPFYFGLKNRFVFLAVNLKRPDRDTAELIPLARFAKAVGFRSPRDDYSSRLASPNELISLGSAYLVGTPAQDATTSFQCNVLTKIEPNVKVGVREGFKIREVDFRLESRSEVSLMGPTNPDANDYTIRNLWEAVYAPSEVDSRLRVFAEPCDASGNPITAIDSEGNPVDLQTLKAYQIEQSKLPSIKRDRIPRYEHVNLRTKFWYEGGKYKLRLAVNPNKIASLRITGEYTSIFYIRDIPLDPKLPKN